MTNPGEKAHVTQQVLEWCHLLRFSVQSIGSHNNNTQLDYLVVFNVEVVMRELRMME